MLGRATTVRLPDRQIGDKLEEVRLVQVEFQAEIGSLLGKKMTAVWPVWRAALIGTGACLVVVTIEFGLPALSSDARRALEILLVAIIGWTLTPFDDTFVAIVAGLAMALLVNRDPGALFQALGDELIWLLLASFILAAAVKASGIADRILGLVIGRMRSARAVAYALTAVMVATAFIIPSTSGRAALMIPAYQAVAGRCGNARLRRAFALLFPTVILLSAFASPVGAGAHLLAIEMVNRLSGVKVSYLEWIALGLPFAAVSTFVSVECLLRLFLSPGERRTALLLPATASNDGVGLARQPILWIAAGVVIAWLTESVHGLNATVIALSGALVASLPGLGAVRFDDAIKSTEWKLLLFLAATICLADGLVASGLHQWLIETTVNPMRVVGLGPLALLSLLALLGLFSHLLIHSRTARVSVLLPPVLMIASTARLDPLLVMLVLVSATGFCQTLMICAKPVALFGGLDDEGYGPKDLAVLSAVLLPVQFLLIVVFAVGAWPMIQGLLVTLGLQVYGGS
ncbi:SLC13 family permease [Mesorhizobium caraganae]|uniref:SLC13 family permease n=1 Tax=Mesorhizobium caraganae TaxID=483206 RepID=UPI003335C682